jgi:hypothetical protein
MAVHLLGIRHHGPGSARAVKTFLETHQPDLLLIEGPPEAEGLLHWLDNAELKPPVALLLYNPDAPSQASFYPFAEFSPEWQAIRYAHTRQVPVRFMDVPAAHTLAQKETSETPNPETPPAPEATVLAAIPESGLPEAAEPETLEIIYRDPISHLAEAAGWSDGEKWWEHQIEHRHHTEPAFEALTEAMTALRELLPPKADPREAIREAWMRKTLRQAENDGFTNIAVICGAWHLPALGGAFKAKDDAALLKGLPKVKVEATWIPWTYDRLSFESGYGAGITSPGWYHHIWQYPEDEGVRWLSEVAGLFRKKGMDMSVAHVIEATRLASNLAALRNLWKPGLTELNDAALAVMCFGDPTLLHLIRRELIVSNRMGTVPDQVPRPPLQSDIDKTAKSLRLPQQPEAKEYTLDLRKEFDLDRSTFLHRLQVLDLSWGRVQHSSGKGTFKEAWSLQWSPELTIEVIEKGVWGNTIPTAATAYLQSKAGPDATLPELAGWLEKALPAVLPEAVTTLSQQLANLAAASHDVTALVQIVPGLARMIRYGNVRNTDAELVSGILDSIFTRITIGLPLAATGIDKDATQKLVQSCREFQSAVTLLQNAAYQHQWQDCLHKIAGTDSIAALMRGFAIRQLKDLNVLPAPELQLLIAQNTSAALPPAAVADWIEGFLSGSGTVLLLDESLWQVINGWVAGLDEATFTEVLPLLRRTFSTFYPAERRQIGEKLTGGTRRASSGTPTQTIDPVRAARSIPVLLDLLGISSSNSNPV